MLPDESWILGSGQAVLLVVWGFCQDEEQPEPGHRQRTLLNQLCVLESIVDFVLNSKTAAVVRTGWAGPCAAALQGGASYGQNGTESLPHPRPLLTWRTPLTTRHASRIW